MDLIPVSSSPLRFIQPAGRRWGQNGRFQRSLSDVGQACVAPLLSSYQAIKLSSYQAIKLSSYQAIKLSSYQAIKLSRVSCT